MRSEIHRTRINRTTVLYEQWGTGPPLLLVHGLSGSARWWRRNIPAFAAHFTVIAVDLAGFGRNRAWRPEPLRAAAGTLGQFIEQLDRGPVQVVGHSMGGHIAAYLAADYPAGVDHLVLAAASILVRANIVRMALRLPRMAQTTGKGFQRTLVADAARAGPFNLVAAARELLADDTNILEHIVAPTLVISGERDRLIPPAIGEQQHCAIRGSQYAVLLRAGHILMWDQPTAFNHIVLDFLLERDNV